MKRQTLRMMLLLVSFAVFPLTVVYLAPAPPLMSLKAGVINLSVITIVSIFLSGLIFRRAFCGWLCPGAGCQLVSHGLNNQRIQQQKTNWFRMIAVGVWVVIMIATVIAAATVPRLDPMHPGAGKFATSEIRYVLPYIPVVIFMFLFVYLFGRRGFCHRGCWINPIIAAGNRLGRVLHTPSLHVRINDAENCTACKLCTKVCPMSIDVYEHVRENTPLPAQCVQCGWCNDTCSKDIFSFSFGSE